MLKVVKKIPYFDIIVEIRMKSLKNTVEYGSTVTLECELIGIHNATSIFWKRKVPNNTTERIIVNGSKYFESTVKNPSLVIVHADENDEGFYICTASTTDENETIVGNKVSVQVRGRYFVLASLYRT